MNIGVLSVAVGLVAAVGGKLMLCNIIMKMIMISMVFALQLQNKQATSVHM